MVIIDSSVAFKWFDETERGSEKALQLLKLHLTKKNTILVPDIILYELANAWATKSALQLEVIRDNFKLLKRYTLKIMNIDFKLLEAAIKMSKNHHVTVYDATYAVLAQEKKCDLITADDKFVDKVNLPFVKKLSDYNN